jgi:hypothetical protein
VIAVTLLSFLVTGTFDASATLGGATPFGGLEYYQEGGMTGSVAVGYDHGRSHCELGGELLNLPGAQQPAYALNDFRISPAYHYAFVNRVDWQLRGGIGLDWNDLTRTLGPVAENGSVFGSTVTFSYVRRLGHPEFLLQLYGSEMLDPGQSGSRAAQDATLIGVRIGVGYEF